MRSRGETARTRGGASNALDLTVRGFLPLRIVGEFQVDAAGDGVPQPGQEQVGLVAGADGGAVYVAVG